jgi:hypothetical protein
MKHFINIALSLSLLAPAASTARPPHHSGGGRPASPGGRSYPVPRSSYVPGHRSGTRLADPGRHWSSGWGYRSSYSWHRGIWPYWGGIPGFWLGAAYFSGRPFDYSNPYWVAPETIYVMPGPDYSTLIPMPRAMDEDEDQPSAVPAEARRDFDAARAAFKAGDYATALGRVNRALKQAPSDIVMHEFRALTLFARGAYRDATAGIYAVLAVGPGWDRSTLMSFYPNEATYTTQLRALERYQQENPNAADGHFLLAYHYLTLEQRSQAIQQLQQVVRLQPGDRLAAELLKALTTPAGNPTPTIDD